MKISDAALMRLSSCKPIINAAVGLGRTLNELFEDTNQLLQGGLTRAVFILKIYENEPAAPVNPPWDTSRESFQVDDVLAYYRIHAVSRFVFMVFVFFEKSQWLKSHGRSEQYASVID